MRKVQIPEVIEVLETVGTLEGEIRHICFDSRKVEQGDLFVALRGTQSDGHDFIDKAIERGAAAIVCEELPLNPGSNVCFFRTNDAHEALGLLASTWFGNPSSKLKIIGVTGTNGKTSIATLLYELFMDLGYGAGLVSTIVNKINRKIYPSTHTTPDPLQLNELFDRMASEGCTYCFMEVSSHAIDQRRISGINFCGGIFTNLTHDHLDYHITFQAYLQAKKRFFDQLPESAFALVNKDDKNGLVMTQNTKASIHTYSQRAMADFRGKVLENSFQGLFLNIDGEEVWFRMIGKFNASNLLAVYASARLLGEEKHKVLEAMSKSEPVNGRFNHFRSPGGITAIVDYAHTPDALKNVLETIREIRTHQEKLTTVVGAGGNRDRSKRPVMAGIAAALSDQVILTSDNPRNEDPMEILREMKSGIEPDQARKVLVIEQREEAIKTACALSGPDDIILVAGKGHETYQEIKGVRHHFDDMEILKEILMNSNH